MDERLLGKAKHRWISGQWPHIARFLRDTGPAGWVDDNFASWSRYAERLTPADQAAGYEEWADFYEWRLKQRAAELATDRCKRYLVNEWTDNMAYCCRRSAAFARAEDPGEWIPQSVRRPDLHAESLAMVAEISTHPHPTAMASTH